MQPTHRRGYPSCHRCRQTVGSPKEPRPAPLTLHPGYYDASGDCTNRHTPDGYERQGQRRELWATIIRHRGRRPGGLCRVLGRRRIAEFNKVGPRGPVAADVEVCQVDEVTQRYGDGAGEPVTTEVEDCQLGQVIPCCGDGAGEPVAAEVKLGQVRQVPQLGRERTTQPIRTVVEREDRQICQVAQFDGDLIGERQLYPWWTKWSPLRSAGLTGRS